MRNRRMTGLRPMHPGRTTQKKKLATGGWSAFSLEDTVICLWPQGLDVGGRIAIMLPELAAEVIYRVEAAGVADMLQGVRCILQHVMRPLQPVPDQHIHWRAPHVF